MHAERERSPAEGLRDAARWTAAAILLVYGFAKLNGSQFTVTDSELTRPMGEVSGFWLTWYYFGYSAAYGTVIALVQVFGGILLTWSRSALVAALVLLPVVVNIILTDVFFGIGALPASILLLVCLVVVVWPDARRLLRAVWDPASGGRPSTIHIAAVSAMLLAAWGFTYWAANFNNRAPTPIDGVWTAAEGEALQTVFFEYNRAHQAVFRFGREPDRRHHFEVGDDGTVRVWERWLERGEQLYEGRITGPTSLELWAVQSGDTLRLERVRRPRDKPEPSG